MSQHQPTPVRYVQPKRYPSPNIPLRAIKRFARQIADKFHPEKIILFGSYAYGTPHEESDVDLLVIMPTRNAIDQSIRICNAFEEYPFSLDLIVRTPRQIQVGLKADDCDWFLKEVMDKGKVLYEAPNSPVGPQGRGRSRLHPSHVRHHSTPKGRGVLPLPADGGEIPQGITPGTRRRRAKNPRPG
jgi:predicted nucleotidyltransferase